MTKGLNNYQIERTIASKISQGDKLGLALTAGKDGDLLTSAKDKLAGLIRAGCIQGSYATKFNLLSVEQKADILDYVMEYFVEWDKVAGEMLKSMDSLRVLFNEE